MTTQALLQFTSKLTDELKTEFLRLIHRNITLQPELVPPNLYFLKKLEKYSLQRVRKTKFELQLSDTEKVQFCVRTDMKY